MKAIRQKAYFRQRVLKEVMREKTVTETARLHRVSRTSVCRWQERYDRTVESLYARSHRPGCHPRRHRMEELQRIRRVWRHDKGLGLVCLHMVLTDKHGYMGSVSSPYRMMRKPGIGRRKQRKRKHIPKPCETPKVAGERVQIDVKYVPKSCLVKGMPQRYQYTAVDECTRLRCRVIFEELTRWNAVRFLHYVRKRFPFDIRCVQTDNGIESTNALLNPGKLSEFERYLRKENITHKRIRVATPGHNGKAERVHRMDGERFYADRVFCWAEDANRQLRRYQRWDNHFPLLVLGRKSPLQFRKDLAGQSVTDHLTT